MLTVTATEFRKHLFEYLDKISQGETIMVMRNSKEVARIVPVSQPNWRTRMTLTPQVKAKESDIIKPMDDIWEEYL